MEKLLQHLNSGFKRIIIWNKYQSRVSRQAQNQYLGYLIDPSFQGINRFFMLSFANDTNQASHKTYLLPTVERKGNNVDTEGKIF